MSEANQTLSCLVGAGVHRPGVRLQAAWSGQAGCWAGGDTRGCEDVPQSLPGQGGC